jgi:hypothetical protein
LCLQITKIVEIARQQSLEENRMFLRFCLYWFLITEVLFTNSELENFANLNAQYALELVASTVLPFSTQFGETGSAYPAIGLEHPMLHWNQAQILYL